MATVDKALLARSSPAGLAWWSGGGKYTDNREEWGWIPANHLMLLSQAIVRAATGGCPRLIVTMPPRHGKSELVSKFTPAWFLGNFPDKKVMLASYADSFAAQWGRKARDVIKDNSELFGVKVNTETSGGQFWELVGHDGVMVTAGVGGGLTGKGAHFLIIDDPVKNAEEAQSENVREAHWDWWRSTVRTRLQKDACVILVMTRWHEDDLAGRMIANDPSRDKDGVLIPPDDDGVISMRTDVEGDTWEVLNLPAFAETALYAPDENGERRDEVGRVQGEVLWPEMFDKEWMDQTKRAMGLYWFTAMYQQTPSPLEGMLFKKKDFRYYERLDTAETSLVTLLRDSGPVVFDISYGPCFQTVDVAASEDQQADYTVVSTWRVTPTGDLIWWDCEWQQFDTTKTGSFVERKYWQFKPAQVKIERLGHGLNVIQELNAKGLPIGRLEPDRDKVSRALPICARYQEGKVFHPLNATWDIQHAEKQLLSFPNTKNDDIVDTVSYAGIELPFMMGVGKTFRSPTTASRRGSAEDRSEVQGRTTTNHERRRRRASHTAGMYHGKL